MLFQEEYLKLTLSLSLKKNPFFIYVPGEHLITLGEGQNKFLYQVKDKTSNKIPVKVLNINDQVCNVNLYYDIDTSQISTDTSEIDKSTLFIKNEKEHKKPYNQEIVVEHSDGTNISWSLVLNEGKKSHLVNRVIKGSNTVLEKKTVDTSKYCYVMTCPSCGELRYCKPASLKLVKLCNACALDRTRSKKALYVRKKRDEKK